MRNSGVRVPVEVVPDGIDPAVYRYVERPRRPGVTTLIVSTIDDRKHVAEGVEAWTRAFRGRPTARLVIKSTYVVPDRRDDDPRIEYVARVEPTRGIARWYDGADVLLALGNEGFGLPALEAMATGLPVIALDSEGQADLCRDAAGLLVPLPPARYEAFVSSVFGPGGVRGVPGVQDVAERLVWVADHLDEAREMGRKAAAWAAKERNVWDKGPRVLDILSRYFFGPA